MAVSLSLLNLSVQFFKQLFQGLRNYLEAFRFIFRHHLYWFVLIPAGLMLAIYYFGDFIAHRKPDYQLDTINDLIWLNLQMLVEISISVLLMKFAKYLVVVLLSPLLAHLSQRCEKIITGNTTPFSFKQLWRDIQRSFRIVVRNFMWEYFFFLILFIVSFLGWEDPASSPVFKLTFVIGFYYYGFSFMDYVNERRKLSVDESILYIRKHRGLAVAIGGIYSLMILVPVDLGILFGFTSKETHTLEDLGAFFGQFGLWLVASIAPVLAIVTATVSMLKERPVPQEEEH